MQDHTFDCDTRLFNVTHENPEWINPSLFGEDFAAWMLARLNERGFDVDPEPSSEDWGWYFDLRYEGVTYTAGFAGMSEGDEDDPGLGHWWITVTKRRSVVQWLTRRGTLTPDDPIKAAVASILGDEMLQLSKDDWAPQPRPDWKEESDLEDEEEHDEFLGLPLPPKDPVQRRRQAIPVALKGCGLSVLAPVIGVWLATILPVWLGVPVASLSFLVALIAFYFGANAIQRMLKRGGDETS